MTKEEMLNDEHKKWVLNKGVKSIYPTEFPAAYKEAAINAMNEFAKQQSVEFNKWQVKNDFYTDTNGIWYRKDGEGIAKSTEVLYEQFIAHQNK